MAENPPAVQHEIRHHRRTADTSRPHSPSFALRRRGLATSLAGVVDLSGILPTVWDQ